MTRTKLATWPRSSQLVLNVGLRCPLIAFHRANVGLRFLSDAGEQLVRVLLQFSFGLSDFQFFEQPKGILLSVDLHRDLDGKIRY